VSSEERRDEDVELGDEVQVRRRTNAALVAVRLSTDLLRRLQEYATERGVTVSDVLRMGAEKVVSEGLTTATSYTVRTVEGITWASREEYTVEPAAAGIWALAR
jgi:hypothetical protein